MARQLHSKQFSKRCRCSKWQTLAPRRSPSGPFHFFIIKFAMPPVTGAPLPPVILCGFCCFLASRSTKETSGPGRRTTNPSQQRAKPKRQTGRRTKIVPREPPESRSAGQTGEPRAGEAGHPRKRRRTQQRKTRELASRKNITRARERAR